MSGARHARVVVQDPAPSINFQFEGERASVAPAYIRVAASQWNARLYIGSVSAAASKPWLEWAGVTHVVCVLGKYAGENALAPEWEFAHKHRFSKIAYLDWAINAAKQRQYWREAFSLLSDALDCAANVVLVHCRNGQDRACFAVYAFFVSCIRWITALLWLMCLGG